MDIVRRKNKPDYRPASPASTNGFKRPPQPEYTPLPQKKKPRKKIIYNIFLWVFSLFILCGIAYGCFFLYKTYRTGEKISTQAGQNSSFLETIKSITDPGLPRIRENDENQVNILLLGMAGEGKPGQNLTDTIMVASINTETNKVALLSIPRDLYVNIPENQASTKINAVYQYGLTASQNDGRKAAETVEKAIADVTGMTMDYYVIINFDGFEKIINDIGGVNIISERDILDERYPGPNYSYETFRLSKGFHHLDGKVALQYARERHDDPEGDFGRAKRQQQIMQAVKGKIFSADTLFNVFALNNLFDTLGNNIKTDIKMEEFSSFLELARKLDTNNINNVVVDAWNKDSLLKVSHVQYGDIQAFILVPRVGNYSEIHDLAENIFDLNNLKRRKEEISQENATIAIINQSGEAQIVSKIKKVLEDNLDYKNTEILPDPTKKTSDKTSVYDITNGQKPFTLDELAAKLPADVSYDIDSDISKIMKDKNPDMIIVIGKDMIAKYNMEEGTLDDLNRFNDSQEQNLFIKN